MTTPSKLEFNDLLQCVLLLYGLYPEQKEWDYYCKLVFACNEKGCLYYHRNGQKIDACGIAYRIEDEEKAYTLPDNSTGDILFVVGFVSLSNNKGLPLIMLRDCIKRNKGIKKILYDRRRST
jgi:hypothetical protein